MNSRVSTRLSALALAACTLTAACSTGRQAEVATGDVARDVGVARWTANLTPQGGGLVTGSATLTPMAGTRTQVVVTVQGAPPNVNLPWHIHRGTCSAPGPIFGAQGSYPMLGTSGDGRAQLQTELLLNPPTVGTHVVDIHAGPGDPTVIACGDISQRSGGDR